MVSKKHPILPLWLVSALVTACIVSGISVAALAFLTAEAYLERPFNPLEPGAQSGNPAVGVPQSEGSEPETEQLPGVQTVEIISVESGEPETINVEATALAAEGQQYVASSTRVTVLVMGIDRRPGEPFISRTDTMMLMSIDPAAQTAAMMSVPRDMYAEIPGFGRDRINTAFVRGAQTGGPAGGAKLAMQAVSLNLGVPIDHYVLIDFSAFIQGVNILGGIEVDVPETINDPTYPDMNYGFDPLFIPAGRQQFDGLTALKYARTRHGDTDFGRSERQQQVILAVRDKVLSLGASDLLTQLPLLYAQLQEGVRTDMSLAQMVALASAASDLPRENIRTAVLDYQYFDSYTTSGGASVLILQNDRVAPLIQSLFFQ